MSKRAKTQEMRSEATRNALIRAGREIFGDIGFYAANVGELAAAASVTRGALYHHFADKTALFEAVARKVGEDLSEHALARQAQGEMDWNWAKMGFETRLEAIAASPQIRRIILVDGPAVLGPERWRKLEDEVMIGGGTKFMIKQQAAGRLIGGDPNTLVRLLVAAMHEAAFIIAQADDPETARATATEALLLLVDGLATEPS